MQLLSKTQMDRIVRRIGFEVIEKNKSATNLVVIGILNRGAIFADQLASTIGKIASVDMKAHHLDVSSYRDDTEREVVVPSNGTQKLDVTDKDVLLVDDVLYTGRTVRAALDAIVGLGRPKSIQLATLIDRGHREYPIEPTYVGRTVPTKYGEHVEVVFDDDPGVFVEG
jgi:pyrimidine operon attenuation protein/uracil phosphoribosyltransferase